MLKGPFCCIKYNAQKIRLKRNWWRDSSFHGNQDSSRGLLGFGILPHHCTTSQKATEWVKLNWFETETKELDLVNGIVNILQTSNI